MRPEPLGFFCYLYSLHSGVKDAVVGEENITFQMCLGLDIYKEMKRETTRARKMTNVDFTEATSYFLLTFYKLLFFFFVLSFHWNGKQRQPCSTVTCRVGWVCRVRRHIISWLGGVISWSPPGAELTSLWQCFHFHQTNIRVLTF